MAWFSTFYELYINSNAIGIYIYGAKNIYIASSFAIGNPGKCASYATTDIEFKFATNGGCIHDAFDMSRQKKFSIW